MNSYIASTSDRSIGGSSIPRSTMRDHSTSAGTSRNSNSVRAPSAAASARKRSRSSLPHVPHSMMAVPPARRTSGATFHCRDSTRARSSLSQRLVPRAVIHSSGQNRTPDRSTCSLIASVVLPLPGRPETTTTHPVPLTSWTLSAHQPRRSGDVWVGRAEGSAGTLALRSRAQLQGGVRHAEHVERGGVGDSHGDAGVGDLDLVTAVRF